MLIRLTQEELTTGIVKAYNYDDNGNRTSFTLTKDGTQQMNTTYAYDRLDRPVSITNGNSTSSYSYDRNGKLLSEITDDYETAFSYSRGGLISGLSTEKGTSIIQNYSYAYYPDGNMSQKQSTINGNSLQYQYQYDNAGRLTREQSGDSVTTYTYDSYNNRTGMNANGVQYSYSYDANNRLTNRTKSENGQQEHMNYTYDNNGNMLSWTKGTEYGQYSYGAYNRLKTYTNGVTNASYTYDGNNLRQSKTVDGVTTNHIWDGANMVMETKGTTVNKYYRGATGLIYSDIDGERRYYHNDEHGNVAAMTNAAGNVINVNTYDAFGNMTQTNESITDPFGYCGEYYDAELEMMYLRNRYYSPSIGRFITEDPVKDGLNWYAYANNNPILFGDSTGLSYEEVIDALEKIYNAKKTMNHSNRGGRNFNTAYQTALEQKEIIRNSDIYMEDWSGLRDILNPIVNGDNNSQESINNVKEQVIAARDAVANRNFWDDILFTGSLTVAAIPLSKAIGGVVSNLSFSGNVVKIGTSFGSLGTLVENPKISVDWTNATAHAIQRMNERGVTKTMVEMWIANGKVLQQSANKYLYITRQGVAVIDKAGRLITTYGADYFDSAIKNIVEMLFG